MQGGADPAGDADLRPAQRQRLRVPDQRRAGHRGRDQERRHRRLRGQQPAVQDPLRRRHQDQQDPLRQERAGLPVRLQARRPGPRPAARTRRSTSSPRSTRTRPRRSACTARARTSCASSSSPTSGCSPTCACCIKTEKYTKRKQTTSLSAIEDQILRSKAAQNADREKELVERVRSAVGKATLVINAADVTSTLAGRRRAGDRRLPGPHQPHLHPAQAARRRHLQRAAGRRVRPTPTAACSTPSTVSKLAAPADEVLSFVLRKDEPRRAGHGQDHRRQLPGQALRLGPRLDRGRRSPG